APPVGLKEEGSSAKPGGLLPALPAPVRSRAAPRPGRRGSDPPAPNGRAPSSGSSRPGSRRPEARESAGGSGSLPSWTRPRAVRAPTRGPPARAGPSTRPARGRRSGKAFSRKEGAGARRNALTDGENPRSLKVGHGTEAGSGVLRGASRPRDRARKGTSRAPAPEDPRKPESARSGDGNARGRA